LLAPTTDLLRYAVSVNAQEPVRTKHPEICTLCAVEDRAPMARYRCLGALRGDGHDVHEDGFLRTLSPGLVGYAKEFDHVCDGITAMHGRPTIGKFIDAEISVRHEPTLPRHAVKSRSRG
jgi:hypothetical protein